MKQLGVTGLVGEEGYTTLERRWRAARRLTLMGFGAATKAKVPKRFFPQRPREVQFPTGAESGR